MTMTNKILITIVVPMLEEKYDIYIPVSKSIKVTKDLLIKTINELSEGHFPIKEKCTLLSSDGKPYENNLIIKECGIKNGDKIVLI